MPLIKSNYQAPFYFFRNPHLQTVLPSLFRKVDGVSYERERLELEDGDFLDLDWVRNGKKRLVIVCHGLEGSSDRHYVKGVIKSLIPFDYDGLALNFRSCSGEMNRLPRFYHHGEIGDLFAVVGKAISQGYQEVNLVGFSLGGSVVVNFLGRLNKKLPDQIKKALAISVPLDLAESGAILEQKNRSFYRKRFLKKLAKKLELKKSLFEGVVAYPPLEKIEYFRQFDNQYTAPLHGFENADDYYKKVSAKYQLKNISIPTLILTARNDPFFGEKSFPYEKLENHPYVYFETPTEGGHVGFQQAGTHQTYAEKRIADWLK